ncbi:group II intron reverse transcriptase domain-containing protein [Candidatus Woesearchaeota archaeon]|nr:group II intron reverse transcriptase domain-containing protein [Candidatus Woesearchaeota archaeon]
MKTHNNLYPKICSYKNLELAFRKASKGKSKKFYVIKFKKNTKQNLLNLQKELLCKNYHPAPLKKFIIKDPKTRKISKSHFRDRVVHHALCNIIEPIFDKSFIYDSYANRKGKGTLKAVERFDYFKRKASKNNTFSCHILKADIKKYFESVDYKILLEIINKKINDKKVIWLINKIVNNYKGNVKNKGMALGNLTSQFFANIYLNQLDHFVKHKLKAKYYIRYVDDFVILDSDKKRLKKHKENINNFLKQKLEIELHPDKSRIIPIGSRLTFLGFRIFYYHKLLKKSNIKKMKNKFNALKREYDKNNIDYDAIYDYMEGWLAYAKNADTYKLRKKLAEKVEMNFPYEISTKEINRIIGEL